MICNYLSYPPCQLGSLLPIIKISLNNAPLRPPVSTFTFLHFFKIMPIFSTSLWLFYILVNYLNSENNICPELIDA